MWLVICPAADLPALWAYRGLRERGIAPLELIGVESLVHAMRWEHRLSSAGATLEIGLADGRRFHSSQIRGTLNRLVQLPADGVRAAEPPDREYAAQELSAFYMSWLQALPGIVLNRPTPQGLCGAWRHPSEWSWLAARAGLPVSRYRLGGDEVSGEASGAMLPSDARVHTIVVSGRICGDPVPPEIQAGCRRLAELAETPLLGVDFAITTRGRWAFAGATPTPDLRRGGEPLLAALASALAGAEEPAA